MRQIAANLYVVFYMLQSIFSWMAKLATLIFFSLFTHFQQKYKQFYKEVVLATLINLFKRNPSWVLYPLLSLVQMQSYQFL